MTEFSKYVYAMGRGPSKARNLTQAEARDAMGQILDGSVDPHAVGALFMLMRYRAETPEEIAGFIEGIRGNGTGWSGLNVTVDWPSYAAGRTRGMPWFLLAAKLVAQRGHPVFLHGWNSHQNPIASVRNGLRDLGIGICADASDAAEILTTDRLVYCPLETLNARALQLLNLRTVLGLRSAVNTALRGYNPTFAPVTLQGVFHPSYRDLQCDAAKLLKQEMMMVIKGGGGEFEVNPSKDTNLFVQKQDDRRHDVISGSVTPTRRLADGPGGDVDLCGLWNGNTENTFAKQIVFATAAAALGACEPGRSYSDTYKVVQRLWDERDA